MILHKARKRLYSHDRWMRYITKKSVRDFNKPVDAAVQRAVTQEVIKKQLEAERRAPIPPRPRKKKRDPVEVLHCNECDAYFTQRDMRVHAHSASLSKLGTVSVTGV